jgi:hypothetical protein
LKNWAFLRKFSQNLEFIREILINLSLNLILNFWVRWVIKFDNKLIPPNAKFCTVLLPAIFKLNSKYDKERKLL